MQSDPKLYDALLYVDLVQMQCMNRPDQCNRFLDIMCDFKNQSWVLHPVTRRLNHTAARIDASTAIERVVSIFHEYPDLINGFTAFLPPGYHIDFNPNDPSIITVTNPSGSSTRITSPAKP